MSAATGLITAAALINSGPAMAEDGLSITIRDEVLAPDAISFTDVRITGELPNKGQLVLAFGTGPLDGTGEHAGWPSSFTMNFSECQAIANQKAVFTCDLGPSFGRLPEFVVSKDAADTAFYRGFAYLPPGGDLGAAIDAARSAGVRPATATSGMSKSVVKSREHALLNTVAFDVPNVPAGKTVRQGLRVHANDAGELYLNFGPAPGQVGWRHEDIRFGNVTTGPGVSCATPSPELMAGLHNLVCQLEPGDHTIGYDLTPAPGTHAWRLQARTSYDIYTRSGWGDANVYEAGTFSIEGAPVLPRHDVLARDASGQLFQYHGRGTAAVPLSSRSAIGGGWQAYDKLTRLAPLTENLDYPKGAAPAGATRGHGELVARDRAGHLWYYDRQFDPYGEPYAARVAVGGGWNVYNQLTGAGDVNQDGRMDLVARDASGTLWLYKGTGATRFAPRVRIGGGWDIYRQFASGADLSGDGRPDLLARDASGVLWLYKGTGKATFPYANRVRVGPGWQVYDQLSLAGDLTGDGEADATARDASGVLWLYKGTGSSTAPFASRSRIGAGWNTYDAVL
ncbi:VCBS repeat-containing protein [Streptomyces sp. NPDC005426]|uniref:VCBS repeat-containing protein n=1 Tax=Streptomyces sp. NPDC005426 TaxID=3155344 RepID=UPI0033A99B96